MGEVPSAEATNTPLPLQYRLGDYRLPNQSPSAPETKRLTD